MERTRDWRRAQRDKAIARARRHMHANGWFYPRYQHQITTEAEITVRKNARTPHPCSRACCGNPRRWFGTATMQERRAQLAG